MSKKILFFFIKIACIVSPIFNYGQLSHIAPAPYIGSAKNFAIFTGNGAIDNNNTAITTSVLGDIGTGAGAVTGFTNTIGVIHIGDPITVSAGMDIRKTFTDMRMLQNTTATYTPNVISTIGNGQVFYPGVYYLGAAATLVGSLTLDAQGDTGAVFILLMGGAFGTDAGSTVTLINKATPSHVYWWVDGAAVIYANTTFQGSIFVNGAFTINTGSIIKGRGLVTTGAIHMNGTEFEGAAQLDSIAVVEALVASNTIAIPVKAYLQGALNTAGTGLYTTLVDNNLVPLAQPYGDAPFNHVSNNVESALTAIPSGVVDWVLVEVLDATNNTVITSRAAFIGSDGNLMDVDGRTGINFAGANIPTGKSYNLGIRHRNHLGVRTINPIAFAVGANNLIDFTAGPAGNLYTDPNIDNPPMVLINGVYSMWAGDMTNSGIICYIGRNNCSGYLLNTILGADIFNTVSTYNNGDINFQGQASFVGRNNSDGYLLNAVLGGDISQFIYQHY